MTAWLEKLFKVKFTWEDLCKEKYVDGVECQKEPE